MIDFDFFLGGGDRQWGVILSKFANMTQGRSQELPFKGAQK